MHPLPHFGPHRRVRGDAYYELMDEFMSAIKARYGSTVLVHFEDMTCENTKQLAGVYRADFPCLANELSGTAAAVLAAVLTGIRRSHSASLADHTFMLSCDDETGPAVADLLAAAIAECCGGIAVDVKARIWLVDAHGLITRQRGDSSTLEWSKLPFCHSGAIAGDLLSAVQAVKPTVLIGLSPSGRPPFKFDRTVVEAVVRGCPTPIILPLSQGPDVEATPAEVVEWSQGAALTAADQQPPPVTAPDGSTVTPSMCSSVYIYPGVQPHSTPEPSHTMLHIRTQSCCSARLHRQNPAQVYPRPGCYTQRCTSSTPNAALNAANNAAPYLQPMLHPTLRPTLLLQSGRSAVLP